MYSTVNEGKLPQKIQGIPMNKSFSFGGEEVPIQNFDVRERLEKELIINSYHHSNTILALKFTERYFPTIERILAEEGLPMDLKYIAVAESGLEPGAASHAGAKGIWQFMKPTAAAYGLEVNNEVDERFHFEKATRAACKYLKELYEQCNQSWVLAAAAYNMGGAGLRKELSDQRASKYWEINTNSETMRYIFRIVAIKEIMENPTIFGYEITQEEKYPPLNDATEAIIQGPISNLGEFAVSQGTNYRMLKIYNPWLIKEQLLNPGKKSYIIRIPRS